MQEVLEKIQRLKTELDELLPMAKESKDILWEKFRLEWNYNSNHIEGNTMTYGQTILLLKLGDEFKAQNNSLKDVNEMRAHDTAIYVLRDWAKEKSRNLTEKDIRELNQIILVKDYWADAQTQQGQPTRRLIKVGEYKEQPNHVKLKSGEIFRYAEPNEVSAKMNELVTWYNSNQDNEHPLLVAAYLHYKFVIIHPFDDGNGKVSRLLMNYHLMKKGYPPLIVKSSDKPNYLYALNQADTSDIEAFVKYLGTQLIWSLETSIKAAKGESIIEKSDLDKEIEVWKKQLKSGLPTNPQRQDKLSMDLYDKSISKLFNQIEERARTFLDLFLDHGFKRGYKLLSENTFFDYYSSSLNQYKYQDSDKLDQFRLILELISPLNKPEAKNIKASSQITVNLNVFSYSFKIVGKEQEISKSYNEFLTDEEIDHLTETVINNLFNEVRKISS